ncbi:MAG TPA: ester cyclase family protein [Baekduia sp.]|nr:ester cyclase family protein [Baekduia sp.]
MTVPTHETNKQLYRDFIACTLGDDLDRLDRYVAPDYRSHAHPGVPPGPEGERQVLAGFSGAFPDFNYQIDHLLADDGHVACVATVSGIHDGEFMGVAPTGKRFEAQVADIMRVEDGKLAEHWSVFDSASMLRQLGLGEGDADIAEQHKELYHGFLERLMSPDLAGLEDYLTPTYFSHSHEAPPGPDGERELVQEFRDPFPDFHYTVKTMVADGTTVASLATVTGTHRGEFLGHAGTGKTFEVLTLDFTHVEDGKFAEHRGVYEEPLMYEQIGIAPPEAV